MPALNPPNRYRLTNRRRGVTPEHYLVGYENFADWPNLTVTLAGRGMNEDELRKVLGLNFLRVFRESVG